MALFDLHKRRINYLRISVTDRCNLRCLYCVSEKGVESLPHEEILTFEEIHRVAEFAVREGIAKIRITGGEPLVRRGVIGLIEKLAAISGLAEISLTTNGTLLEAFARPLYEAGIRRINISLDTLDPDRFREITRGGDMDRLWSGIEACQTLGFEPIKLNMVVLKGVNDGEITDFVGLVMAKPYHVRFIELMPVGAGPYGWEHFVPTRTTMEQVRNCADIKPLASRSYEGPAVQYDLQGAKGTVGFISPVSNHFCHTCNRLRLTADGRLRSCLFSDQEMNLKGVLRGGDGDGSIERGLMKLFRKAVDAKPRAHDLHPGHQCRLCRTMSRIGG